MILTLIYFQADACSNQRVTPLRYIDPSYILCCCLLKLKHLACYLFTHFASGNVEIQSQKMKGSLALKWLRFSFSPLGGNTLHILYSSWWFVIIWVISCQIKSGPFSDCYYKNCKAETANINHFLIHAVFMLYSMRELLLAHTLNNK